MKINKILKTIITILLVIITTVLGVNAVTENDPIMLNLKIIQFLLIAILCVILHLINKKNKQ